MENNIRDVEWKPKIKVGIVVPAINLWSKYTKPCIDSIKTKHDYRIVLIDNASIDETRDEALNMVSEKFVYVHNDIRYGCAQSWNEGATNAFNDGADYVLILNNDVLLHPLAIDEMVDRFIKQTNESVHDNIAMITCFDTRDEVNLILGNIEFNTTNVLSALNDLKIENKQAVAEAESPNFSGYMISKAAYEKIGKFDEEFKPAYFEDNDYHRRINLAGMKAICLPTAMFYHYGSRTQMEALGNGEVVVPSPAFEKNREYYKTKWGGVPGQELFKTPFNKNE